MREKSHKSQTVQDVIIRSVLIGSLTGILICVFLLILCAFMFTKSNNLPYVMVQPMTIAIAGIGAFAGGYCSARVSMERGMMCGMMCGFIMFVAMFIAGLISVRESLTMITVIRFTLMLLTGAIGGIVGVNKRKKV